MGKLKFLLFFAHVPPLWYQFSLMRSAAIFRQQFCVFVKSCNCVPAQVEFRNEKAQVYALSLKKMVNRYRQNLISRMTINDS